MLILSQLKKAFVKPSIGEVLQDKIDAHERGLINAEDSATFHSKMAEYHRQSLQRLRRQCDDWSKEQQPSHTEPIDFASIVKLHTAKTDA